MSLAALLGLLMVVLILGVIVWAGNDLVAKIPLNPVFRTLAIAIIAIICIVIVFYYVLFPLLHAVPG